MMDKATIAKLQQLDWTSYPGSMPLTGVVQPQGRDRARLIARLRRAFASVKARDTV